MKKNWTDPELQNLEISATAGGQTWTDEADGPAVWHEGKWWVPHGISE